MNNNSFSIRARLVDILGETIYPAEVNVKEGRILSINRIPENEIESLEFILPGFIDSHVHIESSMLVPSEFARLAVVHGTVATVSDPHEIANVCGMDGVEFMISNAKTVPFKFYFGAPSCVPATVFETAGARLDADAVERLLKREEIKYLSEMMNFPGVLNNDDQVMKKIAAAHRLSKPVDGHAPGLRGDQARKYIEAGTPGNIGISTDHECFTSAEALDKLKYGMKILIREGSAAKNFEALVDLLNDHSAEMMFCSDDKHPDSLVVGHIDQLCARAASKGINIYKILRAACINPIRHYKLNVGFLNEGDPADFIIVKDLQSFKVSKTYIDGFLLAENGQSRIKTEKSETINNFSCSKKAVGDFQIVPEKDQSNWMRKDEHGRLKAWAIGALDGQLITEKVEAEIGNEEGVACNNLKDDILKIVVVNRYEDKPVAKAFIKNFGLKEGAVASSVAHDSHNIVAVGTDDESLCAAVNEVISHKGGVSFANKTGKMILPLPVAGLMSNEDGYWVADQYSLIDQAVKKAGSILLSPFMTLSFMALLVIPHLKLSDKGLFDGDAFKLI